MKQGVGYFLFLVMLTILLSSCQNKSDKLPVLRLGHAPHDHHSPLYIAALNPDYFKENGGIYLREVTYQHEYRLVSGRRDLATVIVDSSTGGQELIRKLGEEYFDLSFGGFPAMLQAIDQGNPIKIVAPVMTEGAGLVVGKDLAVSTWQDFILYAQQSSSPLKIGYKTDVSVQNLIFERALQASGIPYSTSVNDPNAKIIGVNLHGAKNLLPALENGLVDGFVIMQPYLALAEEKGVGKTIAMLSDMPPEGKWRGVPCCALAANSHYIKDHPEVTEALLILMLRANRFITDNPAESATFIAKWLQVSEAIEQRSLPTIIFTNDFSETWNSGADFWIHSMIESGGLQNKIKKAYEEGQLEQVIYERGFYDKAREQL
ncbi:MAG: ABC transporter substrate-binding protein [Proteobacteria bacterium]|nr:ABC transporter substrate-binding protein [Pseudomonadota bacterium]MBU1640058.1 ABC transporter substrate-binding protein [Pseudomonadota bacterium]